MTVPARTLRPASGALLAQQINAHWPHPVMTPDDEAALADALAAAGVGEQEALEALTEIIADGREFQPRAPQIIAKAREQRERAAAWAPNPERRALPSFASMSDEELRESVRGIGVTPVRQLVGRSIAAIRARSDAAA